MALTWNLLLVGVFGSVSSQYYIADINMAGIQGTMEFNTSSQWIQINLQADCSQFMISFHEFPVMYSNSENPCDHSNIGKKIYGFMANDTTTTLMENALFQIKSDLSDLSVTIDDCRNQSKACATVKKVGNTKTWQGKFFTSVAGDVYIRQNDDENSSRILTDLMANDSSKVGMEVSLYLQVGAENCTLPAQTNGTDTLSLLGKFKVGNPLNPVKSRNDGVTLPNRTPKQFLHMHDGIEWSCTEIRQMEAKQVWAYIDMEAAKGTFTFRQVSPFDITNYTVSLMNLREMASAYHVHNFPVPQRSSPEDKLCGNDNLGGHWNPFRKVASSPSYPQNTNETHDQYEIGDLSGRHGFLNGLKNYEITFKDWNLPLFGKNSIIGRSVVIHHPNSSRWLCATIGYPGEVITAVAIFKSPVAGRIIFRQLKSNPYSDISIFMDLSYTNSSVPTSADHLWHIHEYPISSELDSDSNICLSTKMIFNPFKVDVGSQYRTECGPASPFRCEVGDYAKKHKAINLTNHTNAVDTKFFFTDTTSTLAGPMSIVPRSVVINNANNATSHLACANVTFLRPTSLETDSWRGVENGNGNVAFKQLSDLDRTVVQVNLTDLNGEAGTYSIHTLPIKASLPNTDPCSFTSVEGRYNPFHVNGSLSPEPGNGTVDQYEVGDISGKFGTLNELNQTTEKYMDMNMPLFGPHSIVKRSLVIYRTNGSRLQCANLLAVKATDGEYIRAKAVFTGMVKGTMTLSQQVFADGSLSDTTMEIALEATKANAGGTNDLMWHVHTNPRQYSENCSDVGGHYNPYNIDTGANYQFSCSSAYPLRCEVGDLESKQGLLSLGKRQLMNDINLPLYGDFTVVGRSVVIHNKGPSKTLMDCADIVADNQMKSLVFPKVDSFSRYEFRSTVADVLGIPIWRVTILPGSPSAASTKGCQKISFYMAGTIDESKLVNLDQQEKLGKFKASSKCTSDPSGVAPGLLLNVEQSIFWILTLMLQLVVYTVFE
ncbi:uncharacterized protein cusr [Carcharodon carcharias]|uniref:uncharacterized protein cusr n=1 Tax=Carcharodon carcharias TaxID=13397 RepID=UPI001B7E661F|nr:uncharacterized protein cusr [Carcharodon carcharias]